jgi:hypothetical protein
MIRYQIIRYNGKKYTDLGFIYLEQAIEQVKKYFNKGCGTRITFKGKTVYKY